MTCHGEQEKIQHQEKKKSKTMEFCQIYFPPVSNLVKNSFQRDSSDKEKLFLNLLQETISMLGHKNQSADSVYKSDLPSGDVADQPPKDENSTHEKDAQTTPKVGTLANSKNIIITLTFFLHDQKLKTSRSLARNLHLLYC